MVSPVSATTQRTKRAVDLRIPTTSQSKDHPSDTDSWLSGRCLISMPSMLDPRFKKTVIFICSHDEEGAMGLIINRAHDDITFQKLCAKLKIDGEEDDGIQILSGGPVEIGRGFVLHRASQEYENTLNITDDVALCATMDALQSLAVGEGPPNARVALGYAGWGAGQLEEEILENAWLVCDADASLVLEMTPDKIYDAALARLGVNIAALTSTSGHA